MYRQVNKLYNISKGERLLLLTIFLLMIVSFFVHLCAFSDLLYKNIQYEYNQTNVKSKNLNEIYNIDILAIFCLLSHLIWTIVSIVILDQYYIENNKSIYEILLKQFLCTCPLLLCSELSITFVFHMNYLKNDLLFILIKWFIFLGTIFISFWTGAISDKNKWRGIHGAQIAPEHQTPFYLVYN